MEKELITVIVPVYNAEPYLDRCIKSLLSQTYEHWELLLVNDGSTDASGKICQEYEKKDKRIRVFSKENAGVSRARNDGIEQAKGKYITFVDADDYLDPSMLLILYEALIKSSAMVAGCEFHTFTDETLGERPKQERESVSVYEKEETARWLEERFLSGDTRVWSKLFSMEAVGEVRFDPELTIGEDMLFLLQIMLKKVPLCVISAYGYFYNQNALGAMNKPFVPSYMDQILCWERAAALLAEPYPNLAGKLASLQVMAILLTAGKLASSKSKKEREQYKAVCKKALFACLKVPGSYRQLPIGYRIKAAGFRICPKGYLYLYGRLKGERDE